MNTTDKWVSIYETESDITKRAEKKEMGIYYGHSKKGKKGWTVFCVDCRSHLESGRRPGFGSTGCHQL
jgi:hypothetical protein